MGEKRDLEGLLYIYIYMHPIPLFICVCFDLPLCVLFLCQDLQCVQEDIKRSENTPRPFELLTILNR